jgi:uncharacterized protein YqfA (UPF0365 family)
MVEWLIVFAQSSAPAAVDPMVLAIGGGVVLLALLAIALLNLRLIRLLIKARGAGVEISVQTLFFSRLLMRTRPVDLLGWLVQAKTEGLDVSLEQIQVIHIAGGDPGALMTAMAEARRSGVQLDWETGQMLTLAGRNLLEVVRGAAKSRRLVLTDPDTGRTHVLATAGDGVRLRIALEVKLRVDPKRVIGSGDETRLLQRFRDAIIEVAGRVPDHQRIVDSPQEFARELMEEDPAAGTMYVIRGMTVRASVATA